MKMMDVRGISLTVSDDVFSRNWKYDLSWWKEYLGFLGSLDYNALLFWPYSDIFGRREDARYFSRVLEAAAGAGMKCWYHVDEGLMAKFPAEALQQPLSFMVHYYDVEANKALYRDFLEKLTVRTSTPEIIVRGYVNTPYAVAEARRVFLEKFPGGVFWTSKKYSYEHFAGTRPTLDARLYAEAAAGNLLVWFQTCADFDPFRVISPAYIARCLAGCRDAGAKGFFCHSPHWWTFPRTSCRRGNEPEYERDFLWYKSFSLYSGKSFSASEALYWKKELERRAGVVPGLYRAIDAAGSFIPTVSENFWYSVDFQYHPQTASVFHDFVGPEIYAALRPRHKERDSIAGEVAAFPDAKETGQVHVVKSSAENIHKALSRIQGDKATKVGVSLLGDIRMISRLGDFWSAYLEAIESSYRFAATGLEPQRARAIERYVEAEQAYIEAAGDIEKEYKGFTLGIWGELTTWSENIPEMKKVFAAAKKKLVNFEKTPAFLAGAILEKNALWYRQIMDWPFLDAGVDFFPSHEVIPFTLRAGAGEGGCRLLVVHRDMAPLLRHRARVLAWVKDGGKLLCYNIIKNFSPEFFPSRAQEGFYANTHIYDHLFFTGVRHPLSEGFVNRAALFIPDNNGVRVGPCVTACGKRWEILATVDEEVALGTPRSIMRFPAALLVLRHGKGEIAFSGIRLPEIRIATGYPKKYTEINLTVKKLARNWFEWAGLATPEEEREGTGK